MTAVTFDTLRFVKELEGAGFETVQAEALAEAQRRILAESLDTSLASKADIAAIKMELMEIRSEMKLQRWMIGFTLAALVGVLLMLFRLSLLVGGPV